MMRTSMNRGMTVGPHVNHIDIDMLVIRVTKGNGALKLSLQERHQGRMLFQQSQRCALHALLLPQAVNGAQHIDSNRDEQND